MIHIYHGDGKGKTTAALGLALRALGYGQQVFIVQFLKGSVSGETAALLKMPGVTLLRGKPGTKFVFQMSPEEKAEAAALHERQMNLAFESAFTGKAKLLVLDEALDAVNSGTLNLHALLNMLVACPQDVEVVLTGRNPADEILKLADYITRMKKEKHPYDLGVAARRGVEY